jgi:hypothetical protein
MPQGPMMVLTLVRRSALKAPPQAARAPSPLVITNGHAQTHWGDGTLQGDVEANGHLIMRSTAAGRFEGQISADGTATGNYEGYCVFALAWKRHG